MHSNDYGTSITEHQSRGDSSIIQEKYSSHSSPSEIYLMLLTASLMMKHKIENCRTHSTLGTTSCAVRLRTPAHYHSEQIFFLLLILRWKHCELDMSLCLEKSCGISPYRSYRSRFRTLEMIRLEPNESTEFEITCTFHSTYLD